MQVLITDANIIIDLDRGDLLSKVYLLDHLSFSIPDVLFEEELAAHHPTLLS